MAGNGGARPPSGLSAGAVAQHTAMDKVAVSRAVARLVERGLLERDTHGDDRRRSVLALSGRGRQVHDQVVPLALGHERALLAALDPGERATLDRLLARLDHALDAAAASGPGAPAATGPTTLAESRTAPSRR
jgi:DNA-binding MarR family transcriptional regulator